MGFLPASRVRCYNAGSLNSIRFERVGQSDDIGGVVAFPLAQEGNWANGQRTEVTGGISL